MPRTFCRAQCRGSDFGNELNAMREITFDGSDPNGSPDQSFDDGRGFRKDKRPIRRNRASCALKWEGASWTDRGGRRPFSPEFRPFSPEFRRTLALRVFSTRRYRPFRPAGASDTMAGVRPASRPCVTRGLPSAGLPQARQFFLRRGTREGSEGGCRGLGSSVEVLKDLLDHCRIFDARNHLDRTPTGVADHRS